MAAPLSKVQKKGQITIPAELREKLGLAEGSLVAFILTDEGILISPQEVVAMKALDEIGELLKEKGVTLNDWIESGRRIRGQIINEKYGLDLNE